MANPIPYPQLCLVTDPTLPDLLPRVEAALAAGITMLQLRGHGLTAARLYELARYLRPRCKHYGVLFLVNDRLDVGLAVQADGYQLGRHSLPLAVARQIVGKRPLLAASVHSLADTRTAVIAGADIVLAGTIFPSASHPNEPGCGTTLLTDIKHAYPNVPLLAIGGITTANTREVIEAGATGIAVISAILSAHDIPGIVCNLRQQLNEKR